MGEDQDSSILKVLVELVDQVTEPLHTIGETFESFESDIWGLSAAFGSAFLGYELLEHLIDPAEEFQSAQVKLAIATKATTAELAEFKEQAEDLASRYPSSIDEITQAQTELYKTFRDTAALKEQTELAARLGIVLGIDARQGAVILASAYENLGDQTKTPVVEMQYLSDRLAVLTTMFPASAGGAARMAYDLSRLGASARTYGIDVNQVFAVLGELNRLHVGGARGAGMFAQQLIHTMAAVDEHGVPTMAKYGLQIVKTDKGGVNLIKTLERMSKMSPAALKNLEQHLPGQAQALSQLAAHMDELEAAYGEFKNAGGAGENAATAMQATVAVQMQEMKNAGKDLLDLFGTLTLPAFTRMLVQLKEIIESMEKFSETHPHIAKIIDDFFVWGAVIVTVVGALGFLGKLIEFIASGFGVWKVLLPIITGAWGMLTEAVGLFAIVAEEGLGSLGVALGLLFESNPLGWILTGLALIGVASYEIYKHWDAIKAVMVWIGDHIDSIASKLHVPDFTQHEGQNGAITVSPWGHEFQLRGVTGGADAADREIHVHYMEGAQITVGSSVDLAGLQDTFQTHTRDLSDAIAEVMRGNARTSFADGRR